MIEDERIETIERVIGRGTDCVMISSPRHIDKSHNYIYKALEEQESYCL